MTGPNAYAYVNFAKNMYPSVASLCFECKILDTLCVPWKSLYAVEIGREHLSHIPERASRTIPRFGALHRRLCEPVCL